MEHHGLMTGMLVGGLFMMAVPVSFGLSLGLFLLHRYRSQRASRSRTAEVDVDMGR